MTENWETRFLAGVTVGVDGCWLRSGYTPGRYDTFYDQGKNWRAHRFSYTAYKGAIPAGPNILHACDNPPCVNPDHLWLGDQSDNMRDCSNKGRLNNANATKGACPSGHAFNDANTYIENKKNGRQRRRCRACLLVAQRRRRAA